MIRCGATRFADQIDDHGCLLASNRTPDPEDLSLPKNELRDARHRVPAQPSGKPAPLYLQLTNMYVPAWGYGGPVRLLFDYARWMSRDFQVAVFTGGIHHDFTRIPAKCETIDGVTIYRHKVFCTSLAKKSFYFISPKMLVHAAQRIRSSHGPAIVHFSELRGLVPLYALLLKLVFGRRVILVHSAFGSLHCKRSLLRKLHDALFMRAFVRLVSLRLVQNEHERETYRRICREHGNGNQSQIVLFPLHLDGVLPRSERFTEAGKNRSAVKEARKAYGIPEDALVFLFLGRLHPAKGLLRMVDAFLEFSGSCPRKTLLVIVGRDDGFQASLEEYILQSEIEEKIRIVNNVYESRFDYYFLADVFLGFPTIFEESMLSSIEAMACGTPILVSREADIPFVEEERAGLVIDFDVRTAAAAMAAISRDPASMGKNVRRVVARHFNGAAAATQLRTLFRATLGETLRLEKHGHSEEAAPERSDGEAAITRTSPVAYRE